MIKRQITLIFCCLSLCAAQLFANVSNPDGKDSIGVFSKGQTLLVPVVKTTPETILGESFDAQFKKITSAPKIEPKDLDLNKFGAETVNLNNAAILAAYSPLFAAQGITINPAKRYSVIMMYRLTKTREYSATPAAGKTAFTAAKLHFGHRVLILLEADSNKLNDRLTAKLLRFGGDIAGDLTKRGISFKTVYNGAKARKKTNAPVARIEAEFEQMYIAETPELIAVEYTVESDFTSQPIIFANGLITPGAWTVSRIRVEVESRKPNNNHWDPLMGKPDLIVSLLIGKTEYTKSKVYKNSPVLQWDNCNTRIVLERGKTVQLSVVDKDPEGDDYVGAISIDTDKIFTYEPGQEIYLKIKDDNSGIKNALIVLAPVKK